MFSYESFGIPSTEFDPEKTFVRSAFLSPLSLALLRALVALYCFTTIIVCYSWQAHNLSTTNLKDVNIDSYTIINGSGAIGQSFSFFTYITFWSLGFYFLVSSVHTFMYARYQRTWLHRWPKALQLCHSLYYTSVTTFPFLVSIVFWGTMYSGPWPEGRFEQWINISVHGLNSLFALVEIIVPATNSPACMHLLILLLVLSAYLGLSYLTKLTEGFYVYEWMNPAHGSWSIVLHLLGYTGGIILIFFIVRGAIKLRGYIADIVTVKRWKENREKMIRLDDRSDIDVSSVGVIPKVTFTSV